MSAEERGLGIGEVAMVIEEFIVPDGAIEVTCLVDWVGATGRPQFKVVVPG